MDLETAKNYYITRSRQIIDANESMARDSYGLLEMIAKTKLNRHKDRLGEFYGWLREYDEAYSENISISGSINEVLMKQGKLGIAEKAREIFISSLNSYEKELSNIEGNINFKLTTSIAVLAIIVSVAMGVI